LGELFGQPRINGSSCFGNAPEPIRPSKGKQMSKIMLRATAAVAVLMFCAACDQQTATKETPASETQVAEIKAQPAPGAVERTATGMTNEVAQAVDANAIVTSAEIATGLPAAKVPNPATTLSTATVKTSAGDILGEVRSVVVAPDGMAKAVIVEVGGFLNVGERAVSIDAARLTYLKDRNLLIAAVTKAEIEKMQTAAK
jgi:hypothetical protein